MGEEYGEGAPFQFFTDHIEKRIARATIEGRRKEFAAFAAFAEELPDPQAPETFDRSKLTRREDPAIASLYRDLLRLRAELPRDDPETAFDETERWLRVRRGPVELAMNFAREPRRVPVAGGEIVLATHANELDHGAVMLPGLAGALVR
jgi:maltooligosyltrehalose trehalohydrolase